MALLGDVEVGRPFVVFGDDNEPTLYVYTGLRGGTHFAAPIARRKWNRIWVPVANEQREFPGTTAVVEVEFNISL